MSVKKRLERLTGETKPEATKDERAQKISELRDRIDAIMSRRPESKVSPQAQFRGERVELGDVVRGGEVENTCGRFYLCRDVLNASSYHGSRRIDELSSLDMERTAILANEPELTGCQPTEGLFLDTETTGLAGGTGTMAFLVGIGWFEGETFITEQLFARDFSEERAALAYLSDRAKEKRFLVTFNGKSFDVGLLSVRYIMNRLPDPLSGLPHLDLLHPSRRLLGHRLENSRLGTIEGEVLGLRREGDIPGSEIPQRYFDWLRQRDGRLVEDIFEHNRLDVLSMATLTVHLAGLLGYDAEGNDVCHEDVLASARLLLDRGYGEEAHCFLASLLSSESGGVAFEAGRILSLFHKRSSKWEEAVEIWETMLAEDDCDIFAVEELAKWCEHRAGDCERARSLVENILERATSLTVTERDNLLYRLDRLKRRTDKVR